MNEPNIHISSETPNFREIQVFLPLTWTVDTLMINNVGLDATFDNVTWQHLKLK